MNLPLACKLALLRPLFQHEQRLILLIVQMIGWKQKRKIYYEGTFPIIAYVASEKSCWHYIFKASTCLLKSRSNHFKYVYHLLPCSVTIGTCTANIHRIPGSYSPRTLCNFPPFSLRRKVSSLHAKKSPRMSVTTNFNRSSHFFDFQMFWLNLFSFLSSFPSSRYMDAR